MRQTTPKTIFPKYIQIHTLTHLSGVLANRDDAGLAKRMMVGGTMRTRISSQCLKRHWRVSDDEKYSLSKLGIPMATRSRDIFLLIKERLIADDITKDDAENAAQALVVSVMKQKKTDMADKKKDGKGKSSKKEGENDLPEEDDDATAIEVEAGTLSMKQAILLGNPEIDYLVKVAKEALDQTTDPALLKKVIQERTQAEKANFQQMMITGGLEGALFGRFITSDLLARVDAAIHVAHSYTVHKEMSETDVFTVVDDLIEDTSAGLFDTEINSGLFYGYVTIDFPLLVSNLTGCDPEKWKEADPRMALGVVESIINLIAKTSPGAKKGSTAPYSHAEMVILETGYEQPCTLGNSFRKSVSARDDEDLLDKAAAAIGQYLEDAESMYGKTTNNRYLVAPSRMDEFLPTLERYSLEKAITSIKKDLGE